VEREGVCVDGEREESFVVVRDLVCHLWKPVVGALVAELGTLLTTGWWPGSGSPKACRCDRRRLRTARGATQLDRFSVTGNTGAIGTGIPKLQRYVVLVTVPEGFVSKGTPPP